MCLSVKEYLFKTGDISIGKHIWTLCVSHSVVSDWWFATPWTVASYVHKILQTSILEWLAIPFSRVSSQPRDQTWVSHITGICFTIWDTREVSPRRTHLLISGLQSPSAVILEPKNLKFDTVSTVSPFISHEVMAPNNYAVISKEINIKM